MSLVHKVVVKESPPTPSDDISKGYGVGFKWVDTIEKKAYMTFDCSEGNAVWIEITLSDKMPEGEFKGSWVEGNKRKKFKKRKVSVKFDTFPTAKPSSISLFDVEYEGTANLKIIRITKTKFVFSVMCQNNNGAMVKLSFKYKAVK